MLNHKGDSHPKRINSLHRPDVTSTTQLPIHLSEEDANEVDPNRLGPRAILKLQSLVGNQAVQRLLRAKHTESLSSQPTFPHRQLPSVRGVRRESRPYAEAELAPMMTNGALRVQRNGPDERRLIAAGGSTGGRRLIASGGTVTDQANDIRDMVSSFVVQAGVQLPAVSQARVVQIIEASALHDQAPRLFSLLRRQNLLSSVFKALSNERAERVRQIMEQRYAEQMDSMREHKLLGFNGLPQELKDYWHGRMDADVSQLRLALSLLKGRGQLDGSGIPEILSIFKKWESLDQEHEFNGRLLHEFITFRVAHFSFMRSIGWGARATVNLLDEIRRALKHFPVAYAQVEMTLKRADYHHGVGELPSLAHEVKEAAKDFFINLPAFLAGLPVGAWDALTDVPEGAKQIVKMAWELLKDPLKIVDYAKQLWGMIKNLPEIGKGVLKKWTEGNAFERVFYQGKVIGNILANLVLGALTAGAYQIAKSGKYASIIAKLPDGRITRIGESIAGPATKAREKIGKIAHGIDEWAEKATKRGWTSTVDTNLTGAMDKGLAHVWKWVRGRRKKLKDVDPVKLQQTLASVAQKLKHMGLDDDVIERILKKAPEIAHMKGELYEALIEKHYQKVLKGTPKEMIAGHRITDVDGNQLTDGLIGEQVGDTFRVERVVEAKAGRASKDKLRRSWKKDPERLAQAVDEYRKRNKLDPRQHPTDELLQDPDHLKGIEQEAKKLSHGEPGQLSKTTERLMLSRDLDNAVVLIDGKPVRLDWGIGPPKIEAHVPSDVRFGQRTKEMEGLDFEVRQDITINGKKIRQQDLTEPFKDIEKL